MTKTYGTRKLGFLFCLVGLLCFSAPAVRGDEGDPPSRVARISFLDGTVSFQPSGTEDWSAAAKNRPVTVGDKLWADKDSRAELQAGQATIHLGSMSALSFLNLDENVIQMRLAEGAINFRVRELREGEMYEVDTPNLAFIVKEAGAFRIDVNEAGDATRVTAIRGEGQVTAGGQTYALHAGEGGEFSGVETVQYTASKADAPDGLDRWASERDLRDDNSTSAKYVSREVPGYSDLDDNGTWSEQPEYGAVWYPKDVAADWAPYSSGYWNWVGPWGWTWVDYSPWGFAPFHYGRWAFIGSRWGWCPGPIFARPFFGPAFVGFLGGPRFGVGFGFGFGGGFGIGWFPLGFREPFFPGFRASRGFITSINIRNTSIHNFERFNSNRNFNFAYAHNTRAVTATSRNSFVAGQGINRGAAHLTEASLRGAQVSNRSSFSPTRQSFTGAANAGAHVSAPSSAVQNRSVMARTAPGAAASHMPVRTMNTNGLSAARTATASANNARSAPSGNSARQNQLAQNRPSAASTTQQRGTNGTRTFDAQGKTADRGRAPQGFGSNSPSTAQSARTTRSDRPGWAQPGANGSSPSANPRSGTSVNNNRPSGGNRSYQPPQRSTSSAGAGGNRGYAPQSAGRSYSPPSRSYPSSSRSSSAPSRGSSGGSRGTGGGSPHGGGHH